MGSIGTVGDALDNAAADSFFASVQYELLDRRPGPREPSWPWPCSTGSKGCSTSSVENRKAATTQ